MELYQKTAHPSWKRWSARPAALPSHLPRLLPAGRFQPRFVRRCPVTQAVCARLRLLEWELLPTSLAMQPGGERRVPLAAYLGAYLVKLDYQLPTFKT